MMEGPPVGVSLDDDLPNLPPGFRFHPTDEEIISCYLTKKVLNTNFTAIAIGEADFNKCEPWDLPKIARMGEIEFYFFCQKDRKYPTGMRTNRATASGYWKATGKDKEIFRGEDCLVGMRKTLVFYKGRAPKGEKMNWVMHEYRLAKAKSSPIIPHSAMDEWVVCRIVNKNAGNKKDFVPIQGHKRVNSFGDDHMPELDYASLPPLIDPATCSITQSTGSLPASLEGSYLDRFPEWPSEYLPIKSPVKIRDIITGSNNCYYSNCYNSFGFGQQFKKEVDQQPRSTASPSTEISVVFSNEDPFDADFWK